MLSSPSDVVSLLAQIYADPAGPGLAGNITKALYRPYRDASFAQALPQPAQHGILGPILHARVGDNITVVFQVCPSCFALERLWTLMPLTKRRSVHCSLRIGAHPSGKELEQSHCRCNIKLAGKTKGESE